eukprot:m51a1_g1389 hypothetical protein (303) ;mRNA; r:468239-469214
MEPVHSRVAPTALHTLDDLVFAAFQGPVLSLSSRVLHRYRAFTALLLLRTRWRTDRGLSQRDVSTALLRARCCRPATLAPVQCRICGGVLVVTENVVEQERLRRQIPHGVEVYAATLRTQCTSSRKHVGSTMLVLSAELSHGVVVVSDTFAIYARHAARHVAHEERSRAVARSPDPGAKGGGTPDPPPPLAGADLRGLGPNGMIIGVCILVVEGLNVEDNQAMSMALVPVLQASVPGFLMLKTSIHPTVVISIVGALDHRALALGDEVALRFGKNEIRNPLNRDTLTGGVVRQRLVITSREW